MVSQETQPERGRTWDGVVRRSVDVALRVLDEGTRTVEVIASTESLDSHGDILKQHWDLSRYAKNPTVLWNHNQFESSPYSMGGAIRPEDCFPIGHSDEFRVEGGQLVARIVLGSEEYSAIAQKVYLGCKEKHIRAVSVGFRPGSITRITNPDGSTHHFELGSAERPNELREISFVPMGSNPDAVAKSIASEREHYGRMLAEQEAATRGSQETDAMAMTPEEQAQLSKAIADGKSAGERADKAEKDLAVEKSRADAAEARAKIAEAAHNKAQLDKLQGKKFTPAEREDLDETVEKMGIDFVVKSLEKRADLAVTAPQLNGGVQTRGIEQQTPPPADGSPTNVDAAFNKAVAEASN